MDRDHIIKLTKSCPKRHLYKNPRRRFKSNPRTKRIRKIKKKSLSPKNPKISQKQN
jgi:hypothetical protein